jgi:low temperature requirement protein LtrA
MRAMVGTSRLTGFASIRRRDQRVSFLELFFDLVFVLAVTTVVQFMSDRGGWTGIGEGLIVLGVLWWAWVGYAWLTSVVDPESAPSRLVLFAAIAALLVVSICVPDAFGELGLTLAIAYGFVRAAHIGLFLLASGDDPQLARSVAGLGVSTAIGVGLLVAAAFTDGGVQIGLWIAALVLDMGGPFLFGAEGWRLVPSHFVERHGLVLIIALGESIIAIGVGAEVGVTNAVIVAAVLSVAAVTALWWIYFDVNALIVGHQLETMPPGRLRNEMARDAYSYLHYPMVAGIVLLALGLKEVVAYPGEPLSSYKAAALVGGPALYLVAQVAFKFRGVRTVAVQRLVVAALLVGLAAVGHTMDGWVTLLILVIVLWATIAYEGRHYSEARAEIRARHQEDHAIDDPERAHQHRPATDATPSES